MKFTRLAAVAALVKSGRMAALAKPADINDWGVRKGILFTPYHEAHFRQLLVDAGFEISFHAVTGNCCDVIARKPLNALPHSLPAAPRTI